MAITTKLRKSGASAILTVPKPALEYLQAEVGSTILVEMQDGALICKKQVDSNMTLDRLLADSPKEKLALTDEDTDWLHDKAVGAEI